MVSDYFVALIVLAFGASNVAATGGFPPVNGPPGACGLLPADASCFAVTSACINTLKNVTQVYSNEACVAAASCYPDNPDSFLANLSCRLYGPTGNSSQSADIPRVSDAIASKLSGNGALVTYESFSGWYRSVVTAADSNVIALIDPAFVKMSYNTILAWTGPCSRKAVPKNEIVDWFQFFSTIKGPATTCHLVQNCPITYYPYVMDLTVTCAAHKDALSNPFGIESCVAAALHWQGGVDSFLQAVGCRYGMKFNVANKVPSSNNLPPLTFNLPVTNPPPYTEQNFVDFTTNALASIKNNAVRSFSNNIDFVTRRWGTIVVWTSFCKTKTVPQQNMSDFLKYSHVALTNTSCTGTTSSGDSSA